MLLPTGPTSRRARVSEPTRVTRPTNPRLLANPSHRRKRLLIYRGCRYLFIFPLLTYCCPRYIFFAQDGRRKWGRAGSGSGPKPGDYTYCHILLFITSTQIDHIACIISNTVAYHRPNQLEVALQHLTDRTTLIVDNIPLRYAL